MRGGRPTTAIDRAALGNMRPIIADSDEVAEHGCAPHRVKRTTPNGI
jgi:hypothetical protein